MTPEELQEISETETESQSKYAHTVNVCVAAGCLSCQSQSVKDAVDKEIKARGLEHTCRTKGVGCMGLCSEGPLVSADNKVLYKKVAAGDAPDIVQSLGGSSGEPFDLLDRCSLFPKAEKNCPRKLGRDRCGAD